MYTYADIVAILVAAPISCHDLAQSALDRLALVAAGDRLARHAVQS